MLQNPAPIRLRRGAESPQTRIEVRRFQALIDRRIKLVHGSVGVPAWKGRRRRWGPAPLPPTLLRDGRRFRPAQFGMRSTGLIAVPREESCAARLISASG